MSESSLAELRRVVEVLEPGLRRGLALAWQQAARFEHASIASFARFSLQLLAVGAPAELVAEAHQAAIDEVRHARLCFGLASIYTGQPIGPGPLPMDARVLAELDLKSVTLGTVAEGCVDETLAVEEARASHDAAQHSALREVLATIVRDESRHASLAYRFVAWALAQGGPALCVDVQGAFARGIEAWRCAEASVRDDGRDARWEPHGRLTAASQRAVRLRALDQVIVPAVRSLNM